ncbi:hypothetical protein, partial [Salinivibrio sp. IB643]|uniref:hypothetical protein n=1 Tax=Salinivibrio sp. IB643 TaxID=1909445 RepID=UPI0009D149D9
SRALFLYFLASKSNGIAKFVINDSEKRRALREKYGDHFITNVMVLLNSLLMILKKEERFVRNTVTTLSLMIALKI